MSTNLYVQGTRKAAVKVKGKRKTVVDKTEFSLYQTPTIITRLVLSNGTNEKKIEEYIKWVQSTSDAPYVEPVYDYTAEANEDFEYPKIGYRTVYPAQEHVKELREWLSKCDEEDYTVEFYSV